MKPPHLPEAFSAYIGGAMGRSYHVEYREGRLRYTAYGMHMRKTGDTDITPSRTQWEDFWKALEETEIWRWKAEYNDPDVIDGTHWEVKICHGGNQLHSRGSNAYPVPMKEFEGFLAAVRMLTGGRVFW